MLNTAVLALLISIGLVPAAEAQEVPGGAEAQLSSLSAITLRAAAILDAANATPEIMGSGPYPARMETDLALPNATLYRPADLAALGQRKLGVVIWGNGGCSNDGASARKHLAEIASNGYLVIAPGKMLSGPTAPVGGPAPVPMQITIEDTRNALDWALAENKRRGSPYYQRIDVEAVAAAGHSCGGMLSVLLADDSRIKATIIHNSGIFAVMPDRPPLVMHEQRLQGIRSPVILIMGGERDLAYELGKRAFQLIQQVPVAFASIDAGHEGTFDQPHGGKAAQVALQWLKWHLEGDQEAASYFAGEDCHLCTDSDWEFRARGLP